MVLCRRQQSRNYMHISSDQVAHGSIIHWYSTTASVHIPVSTHFNDCMHIYMHTVIKASRTDNVLYFISTAGFLFLHTLYLAPLKTALPQPLCSSHDLLQW